MAPGASSATVEASIKGVQEIIDGNCDDLPEQAFYMIGTIEDAKEKARQLKSGSKVG